MTIFHVLQHGHKRRILDEPLMPRWVLEQLNNWIANKDSFSHAFVNGELSDLAHGKVQDWLYQYDPDIHGEAELQLYAQ